MSSSFWITFFKEAGIPDSTATNYAASFEDNRITKAMLLDLDKDILRDVGVRMIGDIIAILKHAKTVHAQEVRKKERTGSSERSAIKVAPLPHMHSAPNIEERSEAVIAPLRPSKGPPITPEIIQAVTLAAAAAAADTSLVPHPLHSISHVPEDESIDLRNTISSGHQKKLTAVSRSGISEEGGAAYSSLHSDQLDTSTGADASHVTSPSSAVSTKQPKPNYKTTIAGDYVHEEYTTAAYEARLKTKRHVTDKLVKSPPTKVSRTVILPSGERKLGDNQLGRSKRLLSAAGLIEAASAAEEEPKQRSSVFARLGINKTTGTPATRQQQPSLKSRLGLSLVATGNSHGCLTEPISKQEVSLNVHSRLGPRRSSEEVTTVIKKRRSAPSALHALPSMVADEVETMKEAGIHSRLQKPLVSKPAPIGKRLGMSPVFQRLH